MVTINRGGNVAVDDVGVEVDFAGPVTRILIENKDGTNAIAYTFNDPTLLVGSAPANDAALEASNMYLEALGNRTRSNMAVDKVYLRCSAGKTAIVHIETQ